MADLDAYRDHSKPKNLPVSEDAIESLREQLEVVLKGVREEARQREAAEAMHDQTVQERDEQNRGKLAAEAKLAEVEKERDEIKHTAIRERDRAEGWKGVADRLGASMDRARERLEELKEKTGDSEHHEIIYSVLCLLSGDEEPKTAWPDPDDEPMKATTKEDT